MKNVLYSSVLLAAAASAAPLNKSTSAAAYPDIDGIIINYALTLEHLENSFYAEGLSRFSAADFQLAGVKDPYFYDRLRRIGNDERTHVLTLESMAKKANLNYAKQCTYDFGITNAASFVNLASVLEGVGVSAYLGAAASLTSKDYLTAAGSILTVEARHNAYIRYQKGQSSYPQTFDTPLDLDEVYSLAAPFIKSCPKGNPVLPVKAFPSLTVTNGKGAFGAGKSVTFALGEGVKNANISPDNLYLAWPSVLGPTFTKATLSADKKSVSGKVAPASPAGPNGQAYAILVSGKTLSDSSTVAGPAIVGVSQ